MHSQATNDKNHWSHSSQGAQGLAQAQSNLGVMYGAGQGVEQDYAEAVRWYKLAAAQGNADGQFNLGFMYGAGQGVVQDYAEAVRWYKLAASQGHLMRPPLLINTFPLTSSKFRIVNYTKM